MANPVITVNKIGGKVSFGRDILPSSMRKYQDSCTIQIVVSHGDWPAKGKVIKHSSTREKPRCSTLNATYRHDGSYIPNVDYIALVLAWKNESGYFTVRKATYSNLLLFCGLLCYIVLFYFSLHTIFALFCFDVLVLLFSSFYTLLCYALLCSV